MNDITALIVDDEFRIRKLVKDSNLKMKIPVVYDESLPYKKGNVSSMITSPGIAGLLITNYIINQIINPS